MDAPRRTDLATADESWRIWWFELPVSRRAAIEHHLERCQIYMHTHSTIDPTDRNQASAWKQLIHDAAQDQGADIARVMGVNRSRVSRWINGHGIPATKNADAWRTFLANIAADLYHHHTLRLLWWLWNSEHDRDAPEEITAHTAFLEWSQNVEDHPILKDVPPSLPHDPMLAWPPAS